MTTLLAMFWLLAPQSSGELVREAKEALVHAEQSATQSGETCKSGQWEKCTALLEDVQDSVEKAKDSLEKTGINPSRSPRHFKDAEIRTRKILKVLRAIAGYIHPDDRKKYDAVVDRVSDINDELLHSIFQKKRK
jgi:hypothetical protein